MIRRPIVHRSRGALALAALVAALLAAMMQAGPAQASELRAALRLAKGANMIPPPETLRVTSARVACDGSGKDMPAALGHPRIFLEIDEKGFVDCGYCDRRFILAGGPADKGAEAA